MAEASDMARAMRRHLKNRETKLLQSMRKGLDRAPYLRTCGALDEIDKLAGAITDVMKSLGDGEELDEVKE